VLLLRADLEVEAMTSKSRRPPKRSTIKNPERCGKVPCRKFVYANENQAADAAAHMGGHRVYWSEACQAWHTTSKVTRTF